MKDIIKSEADKQAREAKVTLPFIQSTIEQVFKKTRTMETHVWEVTPVDDDTLRSFFDTAKKEYLSVNPIKIEGSSTLTRKNLPNWLTKERSQSIEWNYLERYLSYLEENGRSKGVIEETRRSSEEIVGRLGDPLSPSTFFVKGLVVGEVQSGKTANFNAVINRAIDSGYKLIIVFSGIMEDLRGQTQDRVESEVVGWGSIDQNGKKWDQNGKKGVGKSLHFGMQGAENIQLIESITSCQTDFSRTLLQSGAALNSPKILVCKKNVSVLKNIINWLGDLLKDEDDRLSVPLLVLDDEADNASLNNEGAKGREYASKVNGHIRAILAMFEKKSYLGYTASPFANVLSDRNDPAESRWPVTSANGERTFDQVDNLFPDDFIVRLKSPTNYIGAKQMFETLAEVPKLPLVSVVDDHTVSFPSRLLKVSGEPVEDIQSKEDWDRRIQDQGSYLGLTNYADYKKETRASKRDDTFPKVLPESLKEAVLCFVLGIAVRESRKAFQSGSDLYEPHNTMLVHVSRFTTWQNETAKLLREYMSATKSRVENDRPDEVGSIYLELERVWNRHFEEIVANISDFLSEGYDDPFMVPVAFEVVKRFLPAAVDGIDVLAINSNTGEKLEYSDRNPRKIIAVGGNRLSRGFTVRGLTVNYFVRSTNYSDTLLQMGRWFGYRPGYLDCCRIFTTYVLIEKFNATTRCIEELETEFEKMHDQGKSPKNFLVKVRKDPGVLQITRPSILKNTTTVKWSFEDKLEMTTRFDVSRAKINETWDSFKRNIAPLFKQSGVSENQLLTAELKGRQIIDFLMLPNNFDPTTLQSMIRFIELCQERGKLTDWTIALKLTGRSKRTISSDQSGLPCETGLVIRNGPGTKRKFDPNRALFLKEEIFRASGKSANIVSSPRDLGVCLKDYEIDEAEHEFLESKIADLVKGGMSEEEARKRKAPTIPERVYREKIAEFQGVLIIYLFDSYYSFNQERQEPDKEFDEFVKNGGYDLNVPLVGYAIGFPPIKDDPGGEYVHGDYDLTQDEGDEDSDFIDDLSLPNDESLNL